MLGRFSAVVAPAEDAAVRLRFEIDKAGVIGWQLYDPETGAFLQEVEWSELRGTAADLRITLPPNDGPYQIQVAPVANRERFISIDARIEGGKVEIAPARVVNASDVRRAR